MTPASRPELAALDIADPPEAWAALGFSLAGPRLWVGGVCLRLGGAGHGITGWWLRGLGAPVSVDGLRVECWPENEAPPETGRHHNGALALDHVVLLTGGFERTALALESVGLPLRRLREVPAQDGAPAFRQGFRRLGPAILELVEAEDPARLWGITFTVDDLDGLSLQLGDRLGPVRTAVQPGRRIAALRAGAGVSPAVAFMSPEPGER